MGKITDIIPPEVHNDSLAHWLTKLAATDGVKDVVEVGSSDGQGSTSAIVRGMMANPRTDLEPCRLSCLEVSLPRFLALENWASNQSPLIRCYRFCSTPIYYWMTEPQVRKFHADHPEMNLAKYDVEEVIGWLRQDVKYCQEASLPQNGLQFIKEIRNIKAWDMAVLDGSEFAGVADLNEVYGSRFIVMDDSMSAKNWDGYNLLLKSLEYTLLAEDKNLRNGWAIFQKVN